MLVKTSSVLLLATAFLCLCPGCKAITKREVVNRVELDLFNKNPQTLKDTFSKIEKLKTTEGDLKTLGFDFSTKNVSVYKGAEAFKMLFGENVFGNNNPTQLETTLPELDRYTLLIFPWKKVTTTSSRIYLNRRKETVVGWDMAFTIMMKDGLVVYKSDKAVDYDTFKSDFALFSGLVEIFGGLGGMVKYAH